MNASNIFYRTTRKVKENGILCSGVNHTETTQTVSVISYNIFTMCVKH